MSETSKPSPWKLLLSSRKFVAAMLYAVISLACVLAARWGLNWNADTATATALPWVLLGITHIAGIAYEDGKAKGAGAGTVATTEATAKGVTTTIDPTGTP